MTVGSRDEAPAVIVARTRDLASVALGSGASGIMDGPEHRAGRAGDTYLVWGVTPSPLALRTAENMLNLYHGRDSPPKRVFYACYAGTHSSVVAASLHLGLLDGGTKVSDLPLFDRRTHSEVGVPALVGVDKFGTEVYALGTGWLSGELERPLCDLIRVASPGARACICSVRGFLDVRARIGGFASRRCRMTRPGRALIASSLTRKVPLMAKAAGRCLDLSSRWNDNEGQPKGEVIWVNASKKGWPRFGGARREPGRLPGD